jgi:3-methyladenine DNA glycosylase AlkD
VDQVDHRLITAIRQGLREAGDAGLAARQQAYMKSTMPYAGVTVPAMRALVRTAAAASPFSTQRAWRATMLALWRGAEVREERYAAVELARLGPYGAYARALTTLPVWRELIVDGAWWDHVDDVAVHLIGPLLVAHPAPVTAAMRRWSTDDDRWLRRSSVICQVGLGEGVDTTLLADCIIANAGDRDFFLRKAIGWALRQHARVDPAWVLDFVETHASTLSPLSRREALRHVGRGHGRQ